MQYLAYSIFFPVVEIVLAFSTGLLVWWGANNSFNAGVIISFIMYLNLFFRPLRVIADKFNVLQMGMIASESVFKVLDNLMHYYPSARETGIMLPYRNKLKGKVEFDKVWFAYNEEQLCFERYFIYCSTGETLAIVGHTGSGKTSIISLLNRLYHIQKGQIK